MAEWTLDLDRGAKILEDAPDLFWRYYHVHGMDLRQNGSRNGHYCDNTYPIQITSYAEQSRLNTRREHSPFKYEE